MTTSTASRALKAFVSYRRRDHFTDTAALPDSGAPFLERLRGALMLLGFAEVFIDARDIAAGDRFEGRIQRAIADCDLFVALIGRNWLGLLNERASGPEPDILEQELLYALHLDKDIVPLLVDGAPMPTAGELPAGLADFAGIDAKAIASDAGSDAIAAGLRVRAEEIANVRRLDRHWNLGYVLFCVLAWTIAAVGTHAVGVVEFGAAWPGLAAAWAGFFIWPVFFFPLILLALHRPFQTLVEASLNAGTRREALSYLSPVLFGTVIAVAATVVETSDPQVPWTIHPRIAGGECGGPADPGPARAGPRQSYLRDIETVASYGSARSLVRFENEFWLKDKCWPSSFFYLTAPVTAGVSDAEYLGERAAVQQAFGRLLATGSKQYKGSDAPYSWLFPVYVVSIFLQIEVLIVAILMAVVYATVSIRRARDGRTLEVPREDAFLCLSYAFATLMVWVPFRMSTNGVKTLYNCLDLTNGCVPGWEVFAKDLSLGLALLIGYVALTVGMLWNHKRVLLAAIGTLIVAAYVASGVAVTRYQATLMSLWAYWQFWMALSLILTLVMIGVWYQYDPAIVRLKDVRRAVRSRTSMRH